MGNLRYSVKTDKPTLTQYPFFSYPLLLGFILSSIVAMVLLFPGKMLMATLVSQADSSDVDFRYSLILLQKHSNSALSYQFIIKNPALALNQLDQDRTTIPKDLNRLWLNYMVLRGIAFNPDFGAAIISQAKVVMMHYWDTFTQIALSESQYQQVAKDALAMDEASIALSFFEQIIAKYPDQPLYFYSTIGKAALWAKQCIKSADFYFMGQKKSTTLKDKRYFYFAALTTLTQCDKSTLAVDLAMKNIDGLAEDMDTYQKLIDIAIAGNQPAKAKEFMFKYLELKIKGKDRI